MYTSLFDAERAIDDWCANKHAARWRMSRRAEYRIASTAYLGTSPPLDAHYANPLADVPAMPTVDEMMNYFERLLKTPALPAVCASSIIPTPAKSTVTRKDTGADGLLVSYAGKSIQATETGLGAALDAVMTKTPENRLQTRNSDTSETALYAKLPHYQGIREIKATRTLNDTVYYAFQLIADRSGVWTWVKASDCAIVDREQKPEAA